MPLKAHRKAGTPYLLQQRIEIVEPGLRYELGAVAVLAHRPEEATHLGERFSARLLDAFQRVSVLGERLRELVPDGADLSTITRLPSRGRTDIPGT